MFLFYFVTVTGLWKKQLNQQKSNLIHKDKPDLKSRDLFLLPGQVVIWWLFIQIKVGLENSPLHCLRI